MDWVSSGADSSDTRVSAVGERNRRATIEPRSESLRWRSHRIPHHHLAHEPSIPRFWTEGSEVRREGRSQATALLELLELEGQTIELTGKRLGKSSWIRQVTDVGHVGTSHDQTRPKVVVPLVGIATFGLGLILLTAGVTLGTTSVVGVLETAYLTIAGLGLTTSSAGFLGSLAKSQS